MAYLMGYGLTSNVFKDLSEYRIINSSQREIQDYFILEFGHVTAKVNSVYSLNQDSSSGLGCLQ